MGTQPLARSRQRGNAKRRQRAHSLSPRPRPLRRVHRLNRRQSPRILSQGAGRFRRHGDPAGSAGPCSTVSHEQITATRSTRSKWSYQTSTEWILLRTAFLGQSTVKTYIKTDPAFLALTKDADGDCRCERVPTPNQLGIEGAPGDGKALRDTTFSFPPFFSGALEIEVAGRRFLNLNPSLRLLFSSCRNSSRHEDNPCRAAGFQFQVADLLSFSIRKSSVI